MTYKKEIPIQTIVFEHDNYLILQVRVCRKCCQTIEVIDGNHKLYFDKENRVATHEHVQCPPPEGYFGT